MNPIKEQIQKICSLMIDTIDSEWDLIQLECWLSESRLRNKKHFFYNSRKYDIDYIDYLDTEIRYLRSIVPSNEGAFSYLLIKLNRNGDFDIDYGYDEIDWSIKKAFL